MKKELEKKQQEFLQKEKDNKELKKDIKQRTKNLKFALQKAEEANRLKSLFLANMSHEIRTPLNSIIGFSELLTDNDYDDQSKKLFSKQIDNNSRHLLELIDQIFHLAIIETGKTKINFQETDLVKLLKKQKKRADNLLEENNKKISFILKTEMHSNISTDKEKLNLILNNLIDNAIKFTKKGKIELQCTRKENDYIFQVKDTGCGLKDDEYEIIFDPFMQGSETLKKIKGGSGLGLSNVKNYVILLGGKVWCTQNSPQGSIFCFSLPAPPLNNEDQSKLFQYQLFKN
ncbi:MAG: HAMP domain-containing sensor histidine kinase [Prolixibacteraceae bacterium]|nr:HAMP domain-containing sensor histidine kinase [Prolixibacteraceae bacterium]